MRDRLPSWMKPPARAVRNRVRSWQPAQPTDLRIDNAVMRLLRCPTCSTPVRGRGDHLCCRRGHLWPVIAGVPVFTGDGAAVQQRPDDHTSNVPGPHCWQDLADGPAPWLHLGAGTTEYLFPGSVELETAIFPNTGIVGDVHRLPFADASFHGVLALNVFEHIEDPDRAAAELFRVLRPGGLVIVQTAFMQPQHADPYHFYNATETGLRRWFRQYDVESVEIPGNLRPLFALAWQASNVLWNSTEEDAALLHDVTLGQLTEMWRDESAREGPIFDAFYRLSDQATRSLAAGFELRARRPGNTAPGST